VDYIVSDYPGRRRQTLAAGIFWRKDEACDHDASSTNSTDRQNYFSPGCDMSKEEFVVVVPQPARTPCPICGKASYSPGGVHPQCAMQQADEPRILRLRAAKVAEAKTKKPPRQTWKKKCPKCGTQLHLRREVCKCGHKFGNR
jgi:predicted RNA-binding Zn-ribbon protein involved in translation (DUF1610 family)